MLDAEPYLLEARLTRPNLVDEYDASSGDIQAAIGCRDKSREQTLNIFADVPGFGQAGTPPMLCRIVR
jgi:hypothetical protein